MELKNAGVVVTGGGSGIGAALAQRLAAAGARVVVNDLNAPAAAAVADAVGGLAVAGDAASARGVACLVAAARRHLCEIDLFCANAGVMVMGGPEAGDDAWDHAWQVNVMAHVRAARELLPAGLARGRGHFLATVSAAGLSTNLGAAPYAVSKHGALAFAEWLAATYGYRGVTVQCLCPQAVRTPMYAGSPAIGKAMIPGDVLEPTDVADLVIEALADHRFLILPHPQAARHTLQRATDPDQWLQKLGRAQRKLDQAIAALLPADRTDG